MGKHCLRREERLLGASRAGDPLGNNWGHKVFGDVLCKLITPLSVPEGSIGTLSKDHCSHMGSYSWYMSLEVNSESQGHLNIFREATMFVMAFL